MVIYQIPSHIPKKLATLDSLPYFHVNLRLKLHGLVTVPFVVRVHIYKMSEVTVFMI